MEYVRNIPSVLRCYVGSFRGLTKISFLQHVKTLDFESVYLEIGVGKTSKNLIMRL